MKISIVLASAVLLIGGCVAPAPKVNWNDPQETVSRVKVVRDDFKKVTKYIGPDSDKSSSAIFIRAWKYDTGIKQYQIYAKHHYYGDWRFYRSAYDRSGKRLKFKSISRDVGSCSYGSCSFNEHMGISVTRQYLEAHKNTGIQFKVSGKTGEVIFQLPAGYIQGFLSVTK